MAIFTFDVSHLLGKVRAVDTRRVVIQVSTDEDLRRARVGQLVALSLPGALEAWLVGIIEKVIKTPVLPDADVDAGGATSATESLSLERESVLNTVHLALVGTVALVPAGGARFSRSLLQVPEIDCDCFVLRDAQLQGFMSLLTAAGDPAKSLDLGKYAIDESARAFLDGNKFFQRHAALLGSTGSGKSWTVAAILERAALLPSANLVVFDLHGEYKKLDYAKHYQIPGPEDLGTESSSLLYLPYWLLNAEEFQTLFIEGGSEYSAQNQVAVLTDTILSAKETFLKDKGKHEVLQSLTIDCPIPFDIQAVLAELKRLNEERVEGKTKAGKGGDYYGKLGRFIFRVQSKLADKRYGFLFQAPASQNEYESMGALMSRMMDYTGGNNQIKIVDFSEVPTEILPVIVGLVARLVYQVQFWTDRDKRRPLALVCDEAHLYLPKKEGCNPVEERAVESFERIAKEGRKYGVSLLIVSQRPSDVSTTILSQCNNVIALRLTNGDDQATVRRLMPESLEGLIDTLPVLDVGEALIVGDAVLLPSRIKITPPKQRPLSATIDFWDEWQKKPGAPDLAKAVENMRRQKRN